MFFLKSDYKSVIAITIAIMILYGCSASVNKNVPIVYPQNAEFGGWPDKDLENRFQEYWFNRFAGRVEDNYRMETPYFREVIGFERYNNYVRHAVINKLVNVEIQKITKETDFLIGITCVMRTQPASGGRPFDTRIVDKWLFIDKKWYHVLKDEILLSL
jgi:hypothetical protein